jgi:hypothetical protein
MESLPFSSPDESPTPRNLSACFSGLNDRQAHGQVQQTARNCAEQFSILSPGEKCESKKGVVGLV